MNEQINEQRRLIEQCHEQLAYMAREQVHHSNLLQPVHVSSVSSAMEQILSLARRFAVSDATVLILDETGVGKDILPMVHSLSGRSEKMLLKVDCGGIAEILNESEFSAICRVLLQAH